MSSGLSLKTRAYFNPRSKISISQIWAWILEKSAGFFSGLIGQILYTTTSLKQSSMKTKKGSIKNLKAQAKF